MANYYLNTNRQPNGDYEVHAGTCVFLPSQENRRYLGQFDYCWQAVAEAKRLFPTWHRINGCYYCSQSCHTT